jgi:predicted RNase H-like nuclease (RuvC/YqgF family)
MHCLRTADFNGKSGGFSVAGCLLFAAHALFPATSRVAARRRRVGENPADDLKECHETVEHLQEEKKELAEENEQLREAAGTFGELAERLNVALAQGRQSTISPLTESAEAEESTNLKN